MKCKLFNWTNKLLIATLIQLNIITIIYCQTTSSVCPSECKANGTQDANCVRQAQLNLTLDCSFDFVKYVRRTDNKTISGFNVAFFSDDFNYTGFDDSPNKLMINKVRAIDSGRNSFQATELKTSNVCNFNLYIYDMENQGGLLTLGPTDYELNPSSLNQASISKANFTIVSFKEDFELKYKYEALPMDALLIDNQKQETVKCNKSLSKYWLNCLETNIKVDIKRCQSVLTHNFSYSFENAEKYAGCDDLDKTPIVPKVYKKEIEIFFPPIIKNNVVRSSFRELKKQTIELECIIECANPLNVIYKWISEKIIIHESQMINQLSHKYSFEIDPNEITDEFQFECHVSNSVDAINNVYRNDSITVFQIKYSSSPDDDSVTEENSTEWPTWLIVTIVLSSLILLLLIVILIVTVLVIRRSKKAKDLSNKSGNGTKFQASKLNNNVSFVEIDLNSRQQRINQELTSNPVYGDVTLRAVNSKNENDKSSSTSSLQNQSNQRSENSSAINKDNQTLV